MWPLVLACPFLESSSPPPLPIHSTRCCLSTWGALGRRPVGAHPFCWPSRCICCMSELTGCGWQDDSRWRSCQTQHVCRALGSRRSLSPSGLSICADLPPFNSTGEWQGGNKGIHCVPQGWPLGRSLHPCRLYTTCSPVLCGGLGLALTEALENLTPWHKQTFAADLMPHEVSPYSLRPVFCQMDIPCEIGSALLALPKASPLSCP